MNAAITLVLMTWFLGNMGIHLFTPNLPAMTNYFSTSSQLVQMTISLFLLGKSLGVIAWGPLSERYGRRLFLLIGLSLYCLSSLLVSQSEHIGIVLLLRFLQGLGVSATVLIGRTIINDLFPEKQAIKAFALLCTSAGIIITFLPLLGGYIAAHASWQVACYVMAGYSFVVLLLSYFYLPETRPYPASSLKLATVIKDYQSVLSHPLFLVYLFISALMVAGESSFNTSASFILIKTHGLSIATYGWLKTTLAIAHLIGSLVCAKVIKHYQSSTVIAFGVISFLVGSSLMLLFNFTHLAIIYALILPMLIYYFGTGFIVATISASIVRPFPKKMATAMAFCIFLQFITSSVFSFISSILNIQTTAPLAIILFTVSTLNFLLWYFYIRTSKTQFRSTVST